MKERPILFSAPMVRAILDGRKTQTRRAVKPQPAIDDDRCSWSVPGWSTSFPAEHAHEWLNSTIERPNPHGFRMTGALDLCPYGQPGDRLWVKETWRPTVAHSCAMDACDCGDITVTYAADGEAVYHSDRNIDPDWTMPKAADRGNVSPLFMPRWASRITLEVTDVRVQRLQDISEADAIAEGVKPGTGGICGDDDIMVPQIMSAHDMRNLDKPMMPAPVARFVLLWDSINGKQPGVTNWNANPWVWALTFRRVAP